ncbi:hypothetical protein ACF090_28670 [Streptomyces sp. NPDC014892]|uniref:hypothetical protein n=1 Tax=Streptomyces sp. NPDC014892 TaxID=3364930 RepID=UPI0036F9B592
MAIGAGIGFAAGDDSRGGGAARPAVARALGAAEKPTGDGIPGDGTFIVGEDIEPGVCRTDGPQGGVVTYCSWTRLKGTTHEAEDVIAADGGTGPVTVTVKASDQAFTASGCERRERVA